MGIKHFKLVHQLVICVTIFVTASFCVLGQENRAIAETEEKVTLKLPESLTKWGIDPQLFKIKCLGGACSPEKRQVIVSQISEILENTPRFLRGTRINVLTWEELKSGEKPFAYAQKQWDTIRIRSSLDDLHRILIHEIAHLWDETDHSFAYKYLKIRFQTETYQKKLHQLWSHVRSINEPRSIRNIDSKVTQILEQNNMLRRGPKDIHASNVYEYWAISVEIFYHYRKTNQMTELQKFLSEEEIEALSQLNW